MEWYLTLSQNVRIEIKGMMAGITGISWEQLTELGFSYKAKIEILHIKLSQYFDI